MSDSVLGKKARSKRLSRWAQHKKQGVYEYLMEKSILSFEAASLALNGAIKRKAF